MEEHVPVLFLDLNDDLLTPCDDDPLSAVRTGELFAEKEATMIRLPIFKRDETQVSPNVYIGNLLCVCGRPLGIMYYSSFVCCNFSMLPPM